jgi:cell wall-associated NlpC family hydrolase
MARLVSPRQAGFVLKLDALGDFVWGKPFGAGQALALDFKDRIATLGNAPGTVTQWGQPNTDMAQTPPASAPSPTRPATTPPAPPTKPAPTNPTPTKPTATPSTASTPAPTKPATSPASNPAPGTTPPLLVAPKPNQEQQARALAVVELAKTYLGTPYRFAGISHEGIDCSGLCMVVYESIGVTLPHKSTVISDIISPKIAPFTELVPGDIVCFAQPVPEAKVNHVGLVSRVEGDKVYFIHASSSEGVQENELTQNQYWAPRYRHSVRPVLGGSLASRLARLAPFEIGD